MKKEKKKDDDFEIEPIVVLIALIGAIATLVFGYHPKEEIIDNIFFYGFGTFIFTIGYTFLIYLLVGIIAFPIAFIICLFSKNK